MRNGINIWDMKDLFDCAKTNQAHINDSWIPARPYGWSDWKTKAKAIKLILTEKADLVIWPGDQ